METIYPYILTLHLICAIIFLGFIFTDVVLFSQVRKHLGDKIADDTFRVILKRGKKIMPLCLLTLIWTGVILISRYVGVDLGFFQSNMQKILVIKALCVLCIVMMVIISFYSNFSKKPHGKFIKWMDKYTHPLALFFGFCIVILAKMAFWF